MDNNLHAKQKVRIEVVDATAVGQRIDNFLLRHLKGVPRSHLYKLMRKGRVRINGKRTKPAYKLQMQDQVRIPPIRVSESSVPAIPEYQLESFSHRIIHEDRQIVVIDKPAGLATHRGSGVAVGVIDILKAMRPDSSDWSLAHRIDRATSGCLIVAKNRQALLTVQNLFRSGAVDKQYQALTLGNWADEPQTINAPLVKNILQSGERMVVVDSSGKNALSHFHLVESFPSASLMRVAIETGRTHQIRVHARHAGHPIAGDQRYGDKSFNRAMRKLGLKRMFLHASRLTLQLPERVTVECPLPGELASFLATLKV
jgi:23S rRNA pseudouridine955/2504/2580 synthase